MYKKYTMQFNNLQRYFKTVTNVQLVELFWEKNKFLRWPLENLTYVNLKKSNNIVYPVFTRQPYQLNPPVVLDKKSQRSWVGIPAGANFS